MNGTICTLIFVLILIVIAFGIYINYHLNWWDFNKENSLAEGDTREIILSKLKTSANELDYTDIFLRAIIVGLVGALLACYLLTYNIVTIGLFFLIAFMIGLLFYVCQYWVLTAKRGKQNAAMLEILNSM